jgi:hypothetical protein
MAANFVLGSQEILNVPQRVRLRFFLTCGLVGRSFEHPQEDIPPSMNQSPITP